jgi:hypothetical protein
VLSLLLVVRVVAGAGRPFAEKNQTRTKTRVGKKPQKTHQKTKKPAVSCGRVPETHLRHSWLAKQTNRRLARLLALVLVVDASPVARSSSLPGKKTVRDPLQPLCPTANSPAGQWLPCCGTQPLLLLSPLLLLLLRRH